MMAGMCPPNSAWITIATWDNESGRARPMAAVRA